MTQLEMFIILFICNILSWLLLWANGSILEHKIESLKAEIKKLKENRSDDK